MNVIGIHAEEFWLEGCSAPCTGTVIRFKVKAGAKPVARQPIPMSPYDELRTEYHLEEWCAQGKMRKIDTAKERLPEWATPVFVVDQDAKGLLGRMVCAYGPVNKCLEASTFPSADPEEAFRRAAGKDHHTLIDAIWGYTQFLVDEATSRVLTVCAKSGLYQMLRMPFGPAPAPPEMQSYVSRTFGSIVDPKTGEKVCVPLMDDLNISSRTFHEHKEHVNLVLDAAAKDGFEFKLTKGQFNKLEIILWGCRCNGKGCLLYTSDAADE